MEGTTVCAGTLRHIITSIEFAPEDDAVLVTLSRAGQVITRRWWPDWEARLEWDRLVSQGWEEVGDVD